MLAKVLVYYTYADARAEFVIPKALVVYCEAAIGDDQVRNLHTMDFTLLHMHTRFFLTTHMLMPVQSS